MEGRGSSLADSLALLQPPRGKWGRVAAPHLPFALYPPPYVADGEKAAPIYASDGCLHRHTLKDCGNIPADIHDSLLDRPTMHDVIGKHRYPLIQMKDGSCRMNKNQRIVVGENAPGRDRVTIPDRPLP